METLNKYEILNLLEFKAFYILITKIFNNNIVFLEINKTTNYISINKLTMEEFKATYVSQIYGELISIDYYDSEINKEKINNSSIEIHRYYKAITTIIDNTSTLIYILNKEKNKKYDKQSQNNSIYYDNFTCLFIIKNKYNNDKSFLRIEKISYSILKTYLIDNENTQPILCYNVNIISNFISQTIVNKVSFPYTPNELLTNSNEIWFYSIEDNSLQYGNIITKHENIIKSITSEIDMSYYIINANNKIYYIPISLTGSSAEEVIKKFDGIKRFEEIKSKFKK